MNLSELPSQSRLLELFDYNSETGDLFWKRREGNDGCIISFNYRFAGKPALNHINSTGYRRGSIYGKSRTAHRVIWKIVYGDDPKIIDHIDGDKTNNRISNLRSVCTAENAKNAKKRKDNKSGVVGVFWLNRERKWCAEIYENGKKINLGQFTSFLDACLAREHAAAKLNYSPRHGV